MSETSRDHADLFAFIRTQYKKQESIPLHVPCLGALEKQRLADCIDSTYVSSVGGAINDFELGLCEFTRSKASIATVNGTAALHLSLLAVGVTAHTEVLAPALSFIATANAIHYCQAEPVFMDVDRETLGLDPIKLKQWLSQHCEITRGRCVNKTTKKEIAACICMHTFGHPCRLKEIASICEEFFIPLVEDAAEALGSFRDGQHVGLVGAVSCLSFNGNKILTTGGGGAVLTQNEELAEIIRHLGSTAKIAHPWESCHDQVGFNYRMPALNAALGCAQIQQLPDFLQAKRLLAKAYEEYLMQSELEWVAEPDQCQSNYWLNAILCRDANQQQSLLDAATRHNIQLRPVWQLLSDSQPYQHCQHDDLTVSRDVSARLVNLPSAVAGLRYA